MSRHVLEPRQDHGHHIVVGWDPPMGTFYGLVFSPDDDLLVDLGDLSDRIYQPSLVLDAVRAYAAIPIGLEHTLLDDALTDTARQTITRGRTDA